ncbi:cation diffusion facilitator family transporter [Lyngbya sp. PCC 8106]|uniref:cation diffusion facilitator family transporter n=1 Tax=Lyngbya sp. (strain PCC 8106) TaxID=313612 RepID=UPI0000EAAA50|nr:cation diffusion facilitator family transporter [Lyngbya sp. PCC 8106]EAW35943.1 Cation efflux protein [Lyngbya sp. PCC 8106]
MVIDNRPKIRKVLILTLVLNIVVMAIKATLGLLTGSLSLLADALHSVTDGANNIIGLVANQFASPEPDREYPYGHQKFDALGALAVTVFLSIASFEILSSAIQRIFVGGDAINIDSGALWILLIVLGINIFVAYYERYMGQKLGSSFLVADAQHTMSDIWTTLMVIGGLIGVWLGRKWNVPQLEALDVVMAFPVAVLVFHSAWEILKENLPWLTDRMAIPPEKIRALAMRVPGVINCHDIASRGVVGRQIFIEMHMIVEADDVKSAHNITEQVEAQLEKHFSPVRTVIHVEPLSYKSDRITYEGDLEE